MLGSSASGCGSENSAAKLSPVAPSGAPSSGPACGPISTSGSGGSQLLAHGVGRRPAQQECADGIVLHADDYSGGKHQNAGKFHDLADFLFAPRCAHFSPPSNFSKSAARGSTGSYGGPGISQMMRGGLRCPSALGFSKAQSAKVCNERNRVGAPRSSLLSLSRSSRPTFTGSLTAKIASPSSRWLRGLGCASVCAGPDAASAARSAGAGELSSASFLCIRFSTSACFAAE